MISVRLNRGRHRDEGSRERERMLRHSTKILAGRIYKVPSEWMPGGPGRSNHIWNSYADGIRGEKGGAEIEASMPRPIRTPRSAPLRARPQISHPAESANGRPVYQTRDFLRPVARKSSKPERSLDERREWIESTEDKLVTINEEILWSRTAHNRSAKVNRKRHQLLLHSKPQSIRGLMMGSCT